MTSIIKWGIIGCGKVTEIKSGPAYQKVPGFELFAVMRRDLEKAKDYALRHQVPHAFQEAEELISHPEIKAIYIATPPDSHLYYAKLVAQAGKICCIEKPMAPSYKDCVEITNLFQEKKLPLFVAYYRRSLPRFNKVKELVDNGKIGQLRHVNWSFCKPPNDIDISRNYNWRTDSSIAFAGYFDDLASHGLDLFSYLFGKAKMATGICENQQGYYSSKDAIAGAWVYESGMTGSGFWNFGAEERRDIVELYGHKGKITFSIFNEMPIEVNSGTNNESFTIENPPHIQYFHVKNMQLALTSSYQHPSSGVTASHTAWLMDKILGRI